MEMGKDGNRTGNRSGNVEMWKCMQGKDVCAKEKMEHGTEKIWKQGTDGNLHVYQPRYSCTVLVLGKRYKDGKWTTPGTWRN